MLNGKERSVRGICRAAVILAALAVVAAAAPVRAADGDYKGWYVTLDAAWTQPDSLDHHYANQVVLGVGGAIADTRRLTLNTETDLTGMIKVGYGFGKGDGQIEASYWSFDNEDSRSGAISGYVVGALFDYDSVSYIQYLVDPFRADASAKTKAATIDLDYVRPIPIGEKFTVRWLAGIRSATWDEDQAFVGEDSYAIYIHQTRHVESNAFGLRVGVTGVFKFGKSFQLEGSFASSFLQADTKGDAMQDFGGGFFETAHAEDKNIRGEIRDYDLKAVWTTKRMDYFVGWCQSDWGGMVTDPLPMESSVVGSLAPRGRDEIAFTSLHAGLTFRFGK